MNLEKNNSENQQSNQMEISNQNQENTPVNEKQVENEERASDKIEDDQIQKKIKKNDEQPGLENDHDQKRKIKNIDQPKIRENSEQEAIIQEQQESQAKNENNHEKQETKNNDQQQNNTNTEVGKQGEELSRYLRTKPQLSYKDGGICHQCKKKKYVYMCFADQKPTSCQFFKQFFIQLNRKLYCADCLKTGYNEDIVQIMKERTSWRCPFKRKICICNHCVQLYKREGLVSEELKEKLQELEKNSYDDDHRRNQQNEEKKEIDSFGYLEQNNNEKQTQQEKKQFQQSSVKNLLEFNGELIKTFSKGYHSLTKEEILFYNQSILKNFQQLNNFVLLFLDYLLIFNKGGFCLKIQFIQKRIL